MCNIAGYVGVKPAAPILIDMLRREEGWDAGYYTGIATIAEGRLHHAKKTGDLDLLLRTTNAASLPGTIGIIHGRTPSGGGDAWAHPFIGGRGYDSTAYVANGSAGCFADRNAQVGVCAADLAQRGYVFTSRQAKAIDPYPTLPDGGCVHMSDVMAQLITHHIDAGTAPDAAMRAAFCEMPAEIVGLLLSLAAPDCIAWSRVNMPMFVAFAPHGAYLASTPQAFPDDAGEATLLPACSGGRIYADSFTAAPYKTPPARVAPITPRVLTAAYNAVTQALSQQPHTLPELCTRVKPLFDPADCYPLAALVYTLLGALQKEGRLSVQQKTVPGMRDDLTAPQFFASLTQRG